MVYISKVYTKFGDTGDTMLANGDISRKHAPRVCAYGDVDELNATVGMVRNEVAREPKRVGAEVFLGELDAQLARIQQELFNLGAELATPTKAGDEAPKLRVDDRHVDRIESEIDGWNAALDPLTSFILPGGGPIGSACHLSRTVCRRAEREVTALATDQHVRPEALRYINRLSDYFFVVSRCVSHRLHYEQVLWDQKGT